MRIDALGLMAILAVVLPAVATIVMAVCWKRWQAAPVAKVLVVLGVFFLLVPGTCFGIALGAEGLGLLAPYHP